MKDLLDNHFVPAKGTPVGSVSCDATTKSGDFSLVDNRACSQCKPFFHSSCNNEVLKLHADNPVEIIEHEKLILDLKAEKGGVCDYLISSDNKVLFIDLTCGMSQYLESHLVDGEAKEGKKAKSRKQTEMSINRLYEEQHLASHLDSFPNKVAMLGYRNIDDELFANCSSKITSAEDASLSMMKHLQSRRLATPLSHGFNFVMIRYPDVYNI